LFPITYFTQEITLRPNRRNVPEKTIMSKYSIAFVVPSKSCSQICHRIVEGDTREAALRRFFDEELKAYYSEDEQGFFYFKEDFFDDRTPAGSIIEI
jgi:hypothetical protein